ncbi:MAG TPA: hypothetical protein VI408_11560 [Gaiellaceae bacterium]
MKRLLLLLATLLVLAVPASAARLPILASHDWWPVFSPDSKRIAFTRVDGQGRLFALDVVPAAGGKVVQLAQASSQLMPSWSPDSKTLAYQSGGWIRTVSADGTVRTNVHVGSFPAWSSTGALAYVYAGSLYVGLGKAASGGVIGVPAWSPDGTKIAFIRSDGVYVYDLPSRRSTLVTAPVDEARTVAWSPDGSLLAYSTQRSVYVVAPAAGALPRRLAGPFTLLGPPAWAPASDMVAYTADGSLRATYVDGRTSILAARWAEVGTSFAPGDPHGRVLAYSGARTACPGHSGIRLYGASMLTGTCTIAGTAGADVVDGTSYWGDVVVAGAGNDKVHVNDGHTDRVLCGPGRDEVWADKSDKLVGCEIVHR